MLTLHRGNPKDELWDNAVKFVTIRSHNLSKLAGFTSPPFFPEFLASIRGIKTITKKDLGKLSGLLLPSRDGFEVQLNVSHSLERQNFSFAHEIGHTFFLDRAGQILRKKLQNSLGEKTAIIWEEGLCDIAASELLMPHGIFFKYASRQNFSIDSLIYLGNIFNVSIIPAALRLCDTNPRQCYLVHWDKEDSEELSINRLRATWLTWSRNKTSTTQGRFMKQKLLFSDFRALESYKSDNSMYLREWIRIGKFRGYCQIWSKGFNTGQNRFVLSLIYPEHPR